MIFSLVACADNSDKNGEESTSEEVTTKKLHTEEPDEDDEDEDDDGKEVTKKPNTAAKNEKIKIGLSAPLTGVAAIYGQSVKNAAQMAIDEINADGGLYGIELELKVLDDKYDATRVAANYEELVEWGMQASLGCVTSTLCLEFAKLAKKDNIFVLTPTALSDEVAGEENVYQMCFSDSNQGVAAANYVNSLDFDTIGILYQSDDSYSNGIYEKFKATLREDIQTVEASFISDTFNFAEQIEVLRNCEFIFMPIIDPSAAAGFMVQAQNTVPAGAIYYGCNSFESVEYIIGYDITAIPQKVIMLSEFDLNATEGVAAEFIQNYGERYGFDTLNQFGALTYDSMYAIFGALKEARAQGWNIKSTTSPSDICNILKDKFSSTFVFSGVTDYVIRWSATGLVDKAGVTVVIKDFIQ